LGVLGGALYYVVYFVCADGGGEGVVGGGGVCFVVGLAVVFDFEVGGVAIVVMVDVGVFEGGV